MYSWDKGVCKHSCVSYHFSRVSWSRNAVFLFDFKLELKVSETTHFWWPVSNDFVWVEEGVAFVEVYTYRT